MKNLRDHTISNPDKFYVEIIRHDKDIITRPRSQDQWDGDDILHNWEIDGFEIVDEKEEWDFILNERPEGQLYLICTFYSTGDSFHSEERQLALVSLVKHRDDAKAIIKAIEIDYKTYEACKTHGHIKPLQVYLPAENRTENVYTGTWKGYFERLQSIEAKILNESMKIVFD